MGSPYEACLVVCARILEPSPQLPLGPEIATESQRAIEHVFDRCRDDVGCNARFPDLRQDFETLRADLDSGPVSGVLADPVTAKLETPDFGSEHLGNEIALPL